MKVSEKKIHQAILSDAGSLMRGLGVVASEFGLIPAYELLRYNALNTKYQSKNFGRIDLVLKRMGKHYVTEIKCAPPRGGRESSDFWDSLKVIGYTAYYQWQTGITDAKAAIIVPIGSVKLEQQIIAGKLGLTIFVVYEESGKMKMRELNDKPIWQQK